MIKNTLRLGLAACFLLAVMSCSHDKSLVQDPRMMLDYSLSPNDSTLASLSDDYRNTIDKVKKNDSVKAGIYADYAVSLALAMRFDEADTFFDKEMAAYPESQTYVMFLKERMTTAAGRERVKQQRMLDSIALEEAKAKALGNEFEFEKIRYPKGSKEYKQQQKEKKAARKAKEKEKKAARKAKQKERDQLRDERDTQKKMAQKDREAQKKAAQKEREKQRKQAAKDRKAQKKQQANEREQKREQLQKEREQKRLQAQKNKNATTKPAEPAQPEETPEAPATPVATDTIQTPVAPIAPVPADSTQTNPIPTNN